MRLLARILVCVGICGWLVANTLDWQRALESYEARFTPVLGLPGADRPYFLGSDCYDWLAYAQRMAATGEWRIRHTDIDNTPHGRAMHWSQSIAWMELLAGKIRAVATGEPLIDAIPRAAVWVNPAIFAAGLILLFCLLEIRTGFLPAILAVGWMLSLADVGTAFHPYRPDHQSLHLAFSLAACLLLLCGGAGWVSPGGGKRGFRWLVELAPPTERAAQFYFVAAGVAGGLALWIGATVQIFCLGLLLAGAWSAALLFRREAGGPQLVAGLYRVLGRALAATSLVMYAVEYFPDEFSWRLETNHPLYALAGFAVCELLACALEIRDAKRRLRPRDGLWLILLGGAIVALPAVLGLGGSAVHSLRDPEMRRLHGFINEFQPYASFYDAGLPVALFANFLVLPLFAPAALAGVFFARTAAMERWILWIAAVVALGTLALAIFQQRWIGFYAQFSVVAMALALPVAWRLVERRWRVPALAAAAVVLAAGSAFLFVPQGKRLRDLREGAGIDKQIAKFILIKRFSVQMAHLLGAGKARMMAEPGLAPALYYFGGFPSVASFYWENRDGVRDAAEFFDAADDGAARRIAAARGITHVVLPLNGDAASFFRKVHTGEELPAGDSNFAARLLQGGPLPGWLARDEGFDGFGDCVFGSWKIGHPVGVWRVAPRGERKNP